MPIKASAIALLALAMTAEYASAADIYKRVRPDGVTEYSDQENAQAGSTLHIEIPEDDYEPVLIIRDRPADEVYGTQPRINITPPPWPHWPTTPYDKRIYD